MPQLTIPDEYAAGLAHLIALPDEAIHQLTLALSESSMDVKDASAVASLISARVPAIPSKDLRRIMAALLSLYSARISAEIPPDEFLDDLTQALRRSSRPDLSLDEPAIDRFRSRLKPLLTLGGLLERGTPQHLRQEFWWHDHAPTEGPKIAYRPSGHEGESIRSNKANPWLARWWNNPAENNLAAPSREKLLEVKRQRFTPEGKNERVSRSLAALNQAPSIRLTPEQWREVAEHADLEDQSS